jgi:hypothetical protein
VLRHRFACAAFFLRRRERRQIDERQRELRDRLRFELGAAFPQQLDEAARRIALRWIAVQVALDAVRTLDEVVEHGCRDRRAHACVASVARGLARFRSRPKLFRPWN